MSFEPIDWDELEDATAWDEWAKRHEQRAAERRERAVSASPATPTAVRTTKRVRATLDVTFHGDYVPLDEIPDRLDAWIDAGFNDRDDLRSWKLTVDAMTCEAGDPDGYDS